MPKMSNTAQHFPPLFVMFTMAMLACGTLATQPRHTNAADATDTDLHVKALTFNIRYASANDGENSWPKRQDMVVDVMRQHGGDFIGVQEAMCNQVAALREALPEYKVLSRTRQVDPEEGEAVPIFYRHERWEIDPDEQGTFWLSDTPKVAASTHWGNDIPRIVTWARFIEKATGRGIHFYNVHFDHRAELSRRRSAVLIAQRMAARKHADEPVLLVGDFNSGESSVAIRFLKGKGGVDGAAEASPLPLVDTFRIARPDQKDVRTHHSFQGFREGSKIDFVFASPGTRVIDAAIIHDNRDGRYPSDHYPITAEMILPTSK